MKQLELTFPSGTYLMVEVNETTPIGLFWGSKGGVYWERVGKLSDLKEEDYEGVVVKVFPKVLRTKNGQCLANVEYRTAKETFKMYVEADGWYLENPHGDSPIPEDHPDLAVSDAKWQAAQEKTFNPELTYLFKKI